MTERYSDKVLMKESRSFNEFQSKDEYLQAMVEDLSDWLNYLYNLKDDNQLNLDNFFLLLKNGVILCKHAQLIQSLAEVYIESSNKRGSRSLPIKIGNQPLTVPIHPPRCTTVNFAKAIFSFHERDNVSNFISWCKQFNIPENLTFETEDLVSLKNPRNVVISLLEVSRIGRLFGMEVPDIIQLEQEIEDEIRESKDDEGNIKPYVSVCSERDDFPLESNNNKIEECINGNDSGSINACDHVDSISSHTLEESKPIIRKRDQQYVNIISAEENRTVTDCMKKQENNSGILDAHFSSSLTNNKSFGFKDRRFSINLTNREFLPKVSKTEHTTNLLNSLPNGESFNLLSSLKYNHANAAIRKSQSVLFNDDNSDNDSNFSQSSRSDFKIPKYNTAKPIGRVKIYDNFNKLNYVKEKKTREKVDLRSLDERVREVLSLCQCEEMFPMKRLSEGKYQYGDKNTRIFVRILRTHVMVRVGGGWDTLSDFFFKHDPCRKEKNDNYKYCLPALCKKSGIHVIENRIVPETNTSCSQSDFDFKQEMLNIKKTTSKNSLECGIEDKVLGEENSETENVIDKENFNEVEPTIETVSETREISLCVEPEEETNNNVCDSSEMSKDFTPAKDSAETFQNYPLIIELSQKRRTSLTKIRNNNVKNSLIIPNKIEIKKNTSKIPKSTFQKKK